MAGSFDFALRTRLVHGPDAVDRIGGLAVELGAHQVLLVTDPRIVAAGHAARVERALTSAGVSWRRFDEVRENPSTEDVDACLAAAREAEPDLIVGLGGGSAIDVAKGCNLLLTNGGRMHDYRGGGRAVKPVLPLIAAPTTAGTGSETQSYALIADPETHQKMACGGPEAAPRIALLDPTLTTTQPPFVTACTGLDAIGHAVETAVTRRRNPLSGTFSREAFRLAGASLPRVLRDPDDLGARSDMLLAAAFAGIAIESSMLGAAHSMANPLTARHAIAHGQAVAMALPHVVRFNAEDPGARAHYAELARAAGLAGAAEAPVEALLRTLEALLDAAGFPRSLADCGVPAHAAESLAAEAAEQWTARFNPREVGAADFRELFERACERGSGALR